EPATPDRLGAVKVRVGSREQPLATGGELHTYPALLLGDHPGQRFGDGEEGGAISHLAVQPGEVGGAGVIAGHAVEGEGPGVFQPQAALHEDPEHKPTGVGWEPGEVGR